MSEGFVTGFSREAYFFLQEVTLVVWAIYNCTS